MIVRMKKASVFCLSSDRDAVLRRLHELGILHIEHITAPAGVDVDEVRAEIARTESVLHALQTHLPKQAQPAPETNISADRLVSRTEELLANVREREGTFDRLTAARDTVAPFGDFDPALVRALAEKGIRVRLLWAVDKKGIVAPDGAWLVPLRKTPAGFFSVLIGEGETPPQAREIPLPDLPLSDLDRRMAETTRAMAAVTRELAALSLHSPLLREHIRRMEDRLASVEARRGMGQAGPIDYLQGYCPVNKVETLSAAAREQGWGLALADPSPDDRVPTLIRSPAWIRPIRALFQLLDIVPGYQEAETRSVFLVFFSLFFAMLVNDAGYGTVLLLLTLALRRRMKNAPAEPFRLLGFLSVCSIVWGVMTGSYFGIADLPAPLRTVEVSWLKDERNLMNLCFLVGAVHLTVAHAWRAVMFINSTRALGQLGWICMTWTMYFAARLLILGEDLPGWVIVVFASGLLLIVLFMTPFRRLKHEWSDHVMLPFSVIGNFADLVSYVRLFAVGAAGLAVAESFNELAVHDGVHGWKAAVAAVLILTVGHSLNVVLALMSILVHGVRLNTLEFSSHVGLEWTGIRYRPFGNLLASERE